MTYTGAKAAQVDFTVTGGAGNDVFNSGSGANDSQFTGGAGTNTFNLQSTGTYAVKDLKGSDVLAVSGVATSVVGTVTADFKATSASTNVAVDNTKVVLTAAAGKDIDMSSSGATTGYTLNGNTGAETITGSAQADVIDGKAANDTIDGGNGADNINGGSGLDSIKGGAGADDFILDDQVKSTTATEVDVITDFTVADTDQLGNFSIADLKGLTVVSNVVSMDDISAIIADDAIKTTTVTGKTDLDAVNTDQITLSSTTAFTTTTLATALSTGGALEIKSDQKRLAASGSVVFYDNNVDTFAAVITNAIEIADGAAGAYVVTNLAQIKGVADATTIVDANLLTIIA